jgi:hypothetical protein
MAFRIKDLIISIVPPEGSDPGGVPPVGRCPCGCDYGYCSFHTYCLGETVPTVYRVPCSCCHPSPSPPTATCKHQTRKPCGTADAIELLALLKAQLKEALKEIEDQEKALNESLRPQTVAEVNQLESDLRDALAELDKRRSELEKEK